MPPARASKQIASAPTAASIELVAGTLEDYARRGIFRGFSRLPVKADSASFRVVWHRDQVFMVTFDAARSTLQFADVLRRVPARSEMNRELKAFICGQQSDELPPHRRIDPALAQLQISNRGGNVSIAIVAQGQNLEYGVRRLVNLVHEIYLGFLIDGGYREYMVETFGLDPDSMV